MNSFTMALRRMTRSKLVDLIATMADRMREKGRTRVRARMQSAAYSEFFDRIEIESSGKVVDEIVRRHPK